MPIERSTLLNIAQLAKLEIAEEGLDHYAREMDKILDFVAAMDSVDTQAIEPIAHPPYLSARLREDEVTAIDEHDLFQTLAPATEDNYYIVPKVVE